MTLLLLLLSLAHARITPNCKKAMDELSAAITAKDHSTCSSLISKCERSCQRPTKSPCFDLKLDCQDLKARPQPEHSAEVAKQPNQDGPAIKSDEADGSLQAAANEDNTQAMKPKENKQKAVPQAPAKAESKQEGFGCTNLITSSNIVLGLIGLISLTFRRRI